MTISNILLLLTFLAYPILSILLLRFIKIEKISRLIKLIFLVLLLHNILFFVGFSFRGDYIDYFIFSIEYFIFCLTVNLLPKTSTFFLRTFRFFGILIIFIGLLFGFIGFALFPLVSQNLEADKLFVFSENNKQYQTRRYSSSTISSVETKYTFETYRILKILFEKRIDKTVFNDQKTSLKIGEENLQIRLTNNFNLQNIIFRSTNGQTFTKELD